MKIMVTGASGFVGSALLEKAVREGHELKALIRKNSEHGRQGVPKEVEVVEADVFDNDLHAHFEGLDAVINLVGIIRDFPSLGITFEHVHYDSTLNIIKSMKKAGVERFVQMSALGAGPESTTEYFKTKWKAELAVKESGLKWTVFRPSVIFGPDDDFVNMLAGQVKMAPVVPIIGDGEYRMQPVSRQNVVDGFIKSLEMDQTIGRAYDVGGPDKISYKEIINEIGNALGKTKVRKIHMPLGMMKTVIKMMEGFSAFPITSGQLQMLLMENVCDHEVYFDEFKINPISFAEGIKEYVGK